MLWIIALLIVIFLAFGAAGIRVTLKIALGLFVLGVVLIAGYLMVDSARRKAETEAARKRIAVSELQFDDLRLGTGSYSSELTGSVRNNSRQYSLSSVELQITLKDCIPAKCDVVGQTSATLYGLDVPPGQVRGIKQGVYFSNLPPRRGEYQWDYHVSAIEGRP